MTETIDLNSIKTVEALKALKADQYDLRESAIVQQERTQRNIVEINARIETLQAEKAVSKASPKNGDAKG